MNRLHGQSMLLLKEASLKACLISCFGARCVLSGPYGKGKQIDKLIEPD